MYVVGLNFQLHCNMFFIVKGLLSMSITISGVISMIATFNCLTLFDHLALSRRLTHYCAVEDLNLLKTRSFEAN